MEHIGTGHWVFAGCFVLVFIAYLVWSYRQDLKLHRIHYRGSMVVLFAIVVVALLLFLFRGYLR